MECYLLKAIAHKTQQRFQTHDLRISLRPLRVLSWIIIQMKLAHGPLDAGYTKRCLKRYHFMDDQTVPQGHHFGATYFCECLKLFHIFCLLGVDATL